MAYKHHILKIILLLFSFVLSNSIKNELLINHVEGNTINLSFHFSNQDLEKQPLQYIANNQSGYPVFNYILSIPYNNDFNNLKYEIISHHILDSPANNKKNYFMEGLKENESAQFNNNMIYISRELIH